VSDYLNASGLQASLDRVGPLRRAKEEMHTLRERLERLEASLEHLEPAVEARQSAPRARPAQRSKSGKTKPKKPGGGTAAGV